MKKKENDFIFSNALKGCKKVENIKIDIPENLRNIFSDFEVYVEDNENSVGESKNKRR